MTTAGLNGVGAAGVQQAGLQQAGGAAGVGGPQAGQRPHPMQRIIQALESGDPARIQKAQAFLQKHPEVAQKMQARLAQDPNGFAQRLAAHGAKDPAGDVQKLQQLLGSVAQAGAAGAGAGAAGGAPAIAPVKTA